MTAFYRHTKTSTYFYRAYIWTFICREKALHIDHTILIIRPQALGRLRISLITTLSNFNVS